MLIFIHLPWVYTCILHFHIEILQITCSTEAYLLSKLVWIHHVNQKHFVLQWKHQNKGQTTDNNNKQPKHNVLIFSVVMEFLGSTANPHIFPELKMYGLISLLLQSLKWWFKQRLMCHRLISPAFVPKTKNSHKDLIWIRINYVKKYTNFINFQRTDIKT